MKKLSTTRGGRLGLWLALLATVLSIVVTGVRLRPSADLTAMFPHGEKVDALGEYVRAFHGGGSGIVLVRGPDRDTVAAAVREARAAMKLCPELGLEDELSTGAMSVGTNEQRAARLDPTRAWAYAGVNAREKLAHALTAEGMDERLAGTRSLLLAPGAEGVEDLLARDPLRLAAIPFEDAATYRAGIGQGEGQRDAQPDSSMTADDGRAALILFHPEGNAFRSADAKRITESVDAALAPIRARRPNVTLDVTGGHAIAAATEKLVRRDVTVSGTLSIALASLMFLLTFGRARALLAVLPPLIVGTAWTAGIAAVFFPHPSALALAFCAVVVGVGVDTGVHVYAALLDARREGLSPDDAAKKARSLTARPTLVAAAAAACAFAALGLSELPAMRQLGILCAAGELLTAVAIVQMTPQIAALLERGVPPPARTPAWVTWLVETAPRRWLRVTLWTTATVVVVLFVAKGGPAAGEATVAIRAQALAPIRTYDALDHLYGGTGGEWITVSHGETLDDAAAHADAVAEVAQMQTAEAVQGVDALVSYAPAPATQRRRFSERDRLDLPAREPMLEAALLRAGFDLEACAPALDAFRHPSNLVIPLNDEAPEAVRDRYLATDETGHPLAVTFLRPNADLPHDGRLNVEMILHAADPSSTVTSFAELEARLHAILAKDLPKVALVAAILVLIALRALLGRFRAVLLALVILGFELIALAVLMRLFHVRWHVYDALVVPVLLGITMDEAVFLLDEAGRHGMRAALEHQGPRVLATALTTAAGFAALLACKFDGLFDVGAVGALGSTLGLIAALGVVTLALGKRPLGESVENETRESEMHTKRRS